jgi:hypothetical protein
VKYDLSLFRGSPQHPAETPTKKKKEEKQEQPRMVIEESLPNINLKKKVAIINPIADMKIDKEAFPFLSDDEQRDLLMRSIPALICRSPRIISWQQPSYPTSQPNNW